jgi:AraC-like DNA-binding protein
MPLRNEDLTKAMEIKNYLEKNYQDYYDYDYLVHKFGMNKFKLKLAFKAVSSDNIYAFITKVRIEQAKYLLETTNLTIGYIAYKVGLDKSNLYIQFKKITGKTPSEWRKNPYPAFTLNYHNEANSEPDTQ